VTDEDAIPEEALEFNPAKIDVSSVFVVEALPSVTNEDAIPEDALEFDPAKTMCLRCSSNRRRTRSGRRRRAPSRP